MDLLESEPQGDLSIEQNPEGVQAGRPPFSGFPVDLGPPPPDANKQESPVMEELWRLAFKSVTDQLEDPSNNEQRQGIDPKPMEEETRE